MNDLNTLNHHPAPCSLAYLKKVSAVIDSALRCQSAPRVRRIRLFLPQGYFCVVNPGKRRPVAECPGLLSHLMTATPGRDFCPGAHVL